MILTKIFFSVKYKKFRTGAVLLQRSWVQIPFRPEFFSGFNFTTALVVYNCDDQP